MKKVLVIAGVIVGIILVIAVAFYFRFQNMARVIDAEKVTDIDLTQVDDGVYTGEFSEFLTAITVEVTIENHEITRIDIIDQ